MFNGLFDFEMKRNFYQAIGFYLFYLILFMAISVIITVTGLAFFKPEGDEAMRLAAMNVGKTVGLVCSNLLCIAIGIRKNYKVRFFTVFMMFFSGCLAFIAGSLLALIPATVFSTFRAKES